MNDWAEGCAERWERRFFEEHTGEVWKAIEGAVREALAKAAEVADEMVCAEDCQHLCCVEARTIRTEIRALGAAKEAK